MVESFTFYLLFDLLLPVLPLYARMLEIPESQIGLIIGFFAVFSMVTSAHFRILNGRHAWLEGARLFSSLRGRRK